MEVFERVQSIISKQLDIEPEMVTLESDLVQDLKADSLDIVEFIMDLESEFNIEIPDEDLPKVTTVGDIVKYVEGAV